jgi:hypothetical protein
MAGATAWRSKGETASGNNGSGGRSPFRTAVTLRRRGGPVYLLYFQAPLGPLTGQKSAGTLSKRVLFLYNSPSPFSPW